MADRRPATQRPGKMAQKRQSYFAVAGGDRLSGEMAVEEEEEDVSETEGGSSASGDGETSATGAGEGMVMGGLGLSAIAWGLRPELIDVVWIDISTSLPHDANP